MTTRTLLLLRHGKSDWSGGEVDLERPLAPRGRRQATETGRWLAGAAIRIDLAVVSPATRARATWDLVAAEVDGPPPVRIEAKVYAASGRELLDVVRELPDDAQGVVVVGHNPGLEDLLEELTGRWERLPTSALAVVELPGPWSAAGKPKARLLASGRPPTRTSLG